VISSIPVLWAELPIPDINTGLCEVLKVAVSPTTYNYQLIKILAISV
jgi:hypothetical protein